MPLHVNFLLLFTTLSMFSGSYTHQSYLRLQGLPCTEQALLDKLGTLSKAYLLAYYLLCCVMCISVSVEIVTMIKNSRWGYSHLSGKPGMHKTSSQAEDLVVNISSLSLKRNSCRGAKYCIRCPVDGGAIWNPTN